MYSSRLLTFHLLDSQTNIFFYHFGFSYGTDCEMLRKFYLSLGILIIMSAFGRKLSKFSSCLHFKYCLICHQPPAIWLGLKKLQSLFLLSKEPTELFYFLLDWQLQSINSYRFRRCFEMQLLRLHVAAARI